MIVEIDPETRLSCDACGHDLEASFRIDKNAIIVRPCEYCLAEAAEAAEDDE